MKNKECITNTADYNLIHRKGKPWGSRFLVMKTLANNMDYSRYGFVVSKRVGNAVVRNRTKRLLREIMRRINIKSGCDIIFITRPGISDAGYNDLKSMVVRLMSQAGLITENHEDTGLSAN
jgi:ribonuclease P protein component